VARMAIADELNIVLTAPEEDELPRPALQRLMRFTGRKP